MLSIENNFLFIHYPKTGGNSIQYALMEHSEDKLIAHPATKDRFGLKSLLFRRNEDAKHASLQIFEKKLDNDVYARLFKFSIIRNPWDRVLSYYLFKNRLRAWKIADREAKQQNAELTFDRFKQTYESWHMETFDKKDFFAFINKRPDREEVMTGLRRYIRLPPADFRGEGALDADIDYLMRYEHLQEDFAHVCKEIGIAPIVLAHRNTTEHTHYSHYYDDETAEHVAQRFQEEIAFGGYRFEPH